MDFQVVGELCEQVDVEIDHVSADKMHDTDDVYDVLTSEFPESDIAIPPKENLYVDDAHNAKRMSNLVAYFALGPKLHSRDFENQQQEMMLAASILNRFTQLGMSESYRAA
ncbi:hypothetical protein [Photobacterium leiognathi]|uniref:hypothetical protein n=1 Tax=Photobacterium leiognathi TaxID=553611 RepID=UPI00273A41D2|nr:hypothetical protein [Photobacterium leiognathi]